VDKEVDEALRRLTAGEARYLRTHSLSKWYDTLTKREVDGREVYVFEDNIPAGESFAVRRHERFAPVPPHVHDYVEMSYVYSGEVHEQLGNDSVHLRQGDICIIDTGVPHQIAETGANDILVNILMRKDYVENLVVSDEAGTGAFSEFVSTSLSSSANHWQYMVCRRERQGGMHGSMVALVRETFFPLQGSDFVVRHLLSLISITVLRDYRCELSSRSGADNQMAEIMRYIDTNFDGLTLSQLAERFGYSPNYLSSLIRSKTGQTFSGIVMSKRLSKAHSLLVHTDLTIMDVAQMSGFSNMTFFYKKYREKYGTVPSQRE
jgi:AraC-like DNA-binding protein/mannose-6-phosphate isomerase-like protein (cupin superfamily)